MFFEVLEQRRLLSITFASSTGLLTVTETNLNDVVRVGQTGNTLSVKEGTKTTNYDLTKTKVKKIAINGLGGNAVPMGWGEVITAAKSGVIDGGDLPIVNMKALKVYEVSKYASMTYHNYGPTNAVMNLEIWNGLSADHQKLMMDLSRAAQEKIREATESVDNFAKAKAELEPFGMTVVEAKVDEFRRVAQEKIWPAYKSQYGALWDDIEGFKA